MHGKTYHFTYIAWTHIYKHTHAHTHTNIHTTHTDTHKHRLRKYIENRNIYRQNTDRQTACGQRAHMPITFTLRLLNRVQRSSVMLSKPCMVNTRLKKTWIGYLSVPVV